MIRQAKLLQHKLIKWRRDIHRQPELGFQEYHTSQYVADVLHTMDIPFQKNIGKLGVVAHIGEGLPVIAIRADMDALPIQEKTQLSYASQCEGVMHACGHDAHTAMLLGVAHLLLNMPDRPAGQFKLIFQPSEERRDEENKSGAQRMIEDGVLDDVDAVIALHVESTLPANKIRMTPNDCMAASDVFHITLKATGGHAAFPHLGHDPIYILSHVIHAIHAVRSRRIDPTRPAVISIASIHTGDAPNVIPNEVMISGSIRSFDNQTRQKIKDEMHNALNIVSALGGEYELEFIEGHPAVHNNVLISEIVAETVTELLGSEALLPTELEMGSEDFAYMTQKVPGAMFMLGARYDERERPHHTPLFAINESVLPTGSALLTQTACYLAQKLPEKRN